ncbi:hypothetical protein [Carboxylicivirga caseinilyticus]|uniref:hypothetical protein n=1 Tax=Carboxylicivirga caseinilyticus TaxID=3417572 RepID=UPI003D3480D1|nr:hypothetical protein [Marinilabiliaceae bacterium A049]
MKLSKIKTAITQRMVNIPGFRSKDPILVLESDDWGSIRMPDQKVYNDLLNNGYKIAESDYNRLDTLESNKDLEALFEVLKRYKDHSGQHPVITANTIVGNPDFEKIEASDFKEYYYETVTDTLNRYKSRDQVKELWMQGYNEGVYHPQFHGREHVNIVRWLEALQKKTPEIMYTFKHKTTFSGIGDYNFMEVLDYNSPEDLKIMNQSLEEGLKMFQDLFGYPSKSFIPPCYAWDSHIEETLAKNGVKYLQGLFIQSVPTGTFGNYKRKYHFMGSQNQYGQYYLIRNAFFEPSLNNSSDPVGECLSRVDLAFKWKKPAIISSHRINFMGSLVENNRTRNLELLDELLKNILKKWPDVRFMSSDQLGDLIAGGER